MAESKRRFQWVLWRVFRWASWWPLVAFKRLDPEETCLARIYRWVLVLGPLELRRWK